MQESENKSAAEIPKWFVDEITLLFSRYPAAKMSAATMIGWWTLLCRMSRDQLRNAIAIAMQKSAEFIPSAPAVLNAIRRDPVDRAVSAWPSVLLGAQRSGGELADEIANEAVRHMGGFKRLGQMPEEELHTWGKKEFERIYAELSERNELRRRLGIEDESRMLTGTDLAGVKTIIGQLAGKLELVK